MFCSKQYHFWMENINYGFEVNFDLMRWMMYKVLIHYIPSGVHQSSTPGVGQGV